MPTKKWDLVPLYAAYFKGDGVTPVAGKVRASVSQRIVRSDGRVIFPEGAVVERTIGDHTDDAVIRSAVMNAWRAADQAAQGEDFDGAAWDAWWEVFLTGAVFFGFPASDDEDITPTGYQVKVEELLPAGKTYYVQPVLADLETVPPGILLGLVDVPPGSPTVPAPIYQKGAPNGVAPLVDGLVPVEFLPEGIGGGDVASVNGQTGVVVLTAGDVGADPAGAATAAQAAAIAAAATDATTKANGAQSAATSAAATDATTKAGAAQSAAVTAAASAAAGLYQPTSAKGAAGGYPSLDGSGVVPDGQLPAGLTRDSELTAAITAAIDALLAGAPGALNTLDELAAAIGDDANFAATITAALAGKQPLDSDLTAIAALTTTTFGRSLLTQASSSAARTALGLGNVNDTADANKPVSTAQAAAIGAKADTAALADVAFTGDFSDLVGTPTLTDASSLSSGLLGVERLPLGAEITVDYYKTVYGAANAWPASRPTARTDITVTWRGPSDPGVVAIAGDVIDLVA